MKIWKAHPAAIVMPPMKAAALQELKQSILDRGQLFDGVLLDGLLLDGRSRQEALRQLVAEKRLPPSTELRVVKWDGEGKTPAGFVDAANDKRRHLTESQRAMVAARLLPFFRKEAKERQREAALATNRKKKQPELNLRSATQGRKASGRAADAAAKAANTTGGGQVSGRAVERADFVRRTDPGLAKQVFEGELTVKQAEKKLRRRKQVTQVKAYVPPEGKCSVLVADVPWRYDDELDGSDAARGGLPYPSMSVEEICALKVPAADDCALWFWVTNAFLIDGTAAKVLAAWDFEPKALLTWVKDRMGAGRYLRNQTEHCILAVRGKPVVVGEAQPNFFTAPRRGHSEKPDEAFAIFEEVTPCAPEARLEMFARAQRKDWRTSGAELAEPPATSDSVAGQTARDNNVAPVDPPSGVPSFSSSGGLVSPSGDRALGSMTTEEVAERTAAKRASAKRAAESAPSAGVSTLDAIASGVMSIESDDEHALALGEVTRLTTLGAGDVVVKERLVILTAEVERYEKQRWPTFIPPVIPGSLTQPGEDEIPF